MFSQASKAGTRENADGFWETLGESSLPEDANTKEVLTYDQARHLGLAPDDDQPG